MNKAKVFWFTGFSGSGKSTLADEMEKYLVSRNISYKLLDGDIIRKEISSNLGFSPEDIITQNQLVVDLCKKYQKDFEIILVSVIAPFRETRAFAREQLSPNYNEVYVRASLQCVIKRDVKGLYKKALKGEIPNFIGISREVPYEEPHNPSITIDTENNDLNNCIVNLKHFFDKVYSK